MPCAQVPERQPTLLTPRGKQVSEVREVPSEIQRCHEEQCKDNLYGKSAIRCVSAASVRVYLTVWVCTNRLCDGKCGKWS